MPFLVIYGNRDEMVPVEMSRNLADALAGSGVEFVYAEVDAHHMNIVVLDEVDALTEIFLADRLRPEE